MMFNIQSKNITALLVLITCLLLTVSEPTSKPIYFSDTTFVEPLDGFQFATIDSSLDFENVVFDTRAYFGFSEFKSHVMFYLTIFKEGAFFAGSTFESAVTFRSTEFVEDAVFNSTTFKLFAQFNDVKIGKNLSFKEANFQGDVSFVNTRVPEVLDFLYVKHIKNTIDLSRMLQREDGTKCKLALLGADISKFKLNIKQFELHFIIDEEHPNSTMGINYSDTQQVYSAVLKKLREDGATEDYEYLDKKLKKITYLHLGWFGKNVINRFQEHVTDYGYSKRIPVILIVSIYLLFFMFNHVIYNRLWSDIYPIPFLAPIVDGSKSKLRSLYNNYLLSAIFTMIVFFGLKIDISLIKPTAGREAQGLLVYFLLMYVTGLVCLAYFVKFIFTT